MKRKQTPQPLSKGNEAFALHCRVDGLKPERELRFAPPRRWRFDFAFPEQMLAVEIEGGIWKGGRHVRGSGFVRDAEKYNTAASMGWKVLRFTTEQVMSGKAIADVKEALR